MVITCTAQSHLLPYTHLLLSSPSPHALYPSPISSVTDRRPVKEAFSVGDGEDAAANSLEETGGVGDSCQNFAARLCHHICIDTWGSYQCRCHPGHVLLQDGHTCAPGECRQPVLASGRWRVGKFPFKIQPCRSTVWKTHKVRSNFKVLLPNTRGDPDSSPALP